MDSKEKNIYESFLFVFILIFIGGYLNAYTYLLHDGYLASMNTGNMARMGIAIVEQKYLEASTYLMSIFANTFGAMIAFLFRHKFAGGGVDRHCQRKCLLTEFFVFVIVAFLPLTLPDFIVNCIISCMCGFQLASFTTWDGNAVATTLASGNIRFMGEHLGSAIVNPTKENIKRFILFFIITFGFTTGVIAGALISNNLSQYSILIPAILVIGLIFIDNDVNKKLTGTAVK